MAININPGSPLRHVATFNGSSNFIAPQGATLAFVSIHGASGGGSGGSGRAQGGVGGTGTISGAFVQIIPGGTHIVTIGAGGNGGAPGNAHVPSQAGGAAGTTIFDGAFQVTGAGGGGAVTRYGQGNAGAVGVGSGTTTLTTVSPAGALIRTGTISSQNTGGSAGGNGGNESGNRYSSGQAGSAGVAGQMHIYI